MFYLRYLYSLTYTDVPHDSHIRWCSVDLIVIRRVPLVEDELVTLPDHPGSVTVFVWFSCCSMVCFQCNILRIIVFLLSHFDLRFLSILWGLQTFPIKTKPQRRCHC